jgi:ArsR family transcriptional regulator
MVRSCVDHIDIDLFVVDAVRMTFSEQNLTGLLHAVADPARRRILTALKERNACALGKDVGLCASDIESRLKLSQPTISHHMSVLTKSGLVQAVKLGQWMWYRRNESALRLLVKNLKESL